MFEEIRNPYIADNDYLCLLKKSKNALESITQLKRQLTQAKLIAEFPLLNNFEFFQGSYSSRVTQNRFFFGEKENKKTDAILVFRSDHQ
jgi:hypothetical protein